MARQNADYQDKVLDEAVQELLEVSFRGEEPDLDAFVKQYPGLERKIKQKFHACQRVGSLFDSLREADDSEFQQVGNEANLVDHKIGAFKITEIIGRGGMGVVCKHHEAMPDHTAIEIHPHS